MIIYHERPPRTARVARKVWDLAVGTHGDLVRGIFFQPSPKVWGEPAWGVDIERLGATAYVCSSDLGEIHLDLYPVGSPR
jgi:hypothetical protein